MTASNEARLISSNASCALEALRPKLRGALVRELTARVEPAAGLEETTPGVAAKDRLTEAVSELADACDGFLRREAIAASFTDDERRELHLGNLSNGVGGGQRVAPTTAFNVIQQCRPTITGQAAPPPAAQAVGSVVHDYNAATGPLVELLDAAGVVAPINTPYDLEYIGY